MSSSDRIKSYAEKWLESKYDKTTDTKESVNILKDELERIKKEEDRYVKAYGLGVINENQLKERTSEVEDKRISLNKQIVDKVQKIRDNSVNIPQPGQIDAFCQQAQKVLSSLSFKSKQEILRNTLEKVIATQEKLQVFGYLPIQEESYVELHSINRNHRSAKCGEIHAF
jgi:hypothetical protein